MKSRIRDWRTKALLQKLLGRLPLGVSLNDALQTWLGGLKELGPYVEAKVEDLTLLLEYLEKSGCSRIEGKSILEIGSGWSPILPICFSLAGAGPIHTVDLNPHFNWKLTQKVLEALEPCLTTIASSSHRPRAVVQQHYEQFRACESSEEFFVASGIRYFAPQDASRLTWMPDESLDLVYSNSVLEHVTPEAIPELMKEAWRVLKPTGLMAHAVACNDHYAHFDRNISFVNYLRYSDKQWRLWNNNLTYQNRLRAPDFIKMAEDCGFQVQVEARACRPGVEEALSQMTVAPQFQHYSPEDLAATTVDFVAAKVG